MKTGDKIAKLRLENNLTQEQLAQLMHVSSQSVARWESEHVWPETEQLIQLSKIFECSLDYLLREDVEKRTYKKDTVGKRASGHLQFEYESQRKVRGIPLLHVCIEKKKVAKGWIAVGIRAKGMIAIGCMATGVISFGILSIGIFALGLFSLGILAFGSVAAGAIALGAVAFGIVSVGACSFGIFSCGAYANGYYVAIGDTAVGKIAIGKSHTSAEIAIKQVWKMGYYQIYNDSGASVVIGREDVCTIIDQNVPQIWNFFKAIIKLFVI